MEIECIERCGNLTAEDSEYCVSCRNMRTMRGWNNE